VAWNRVDGQDPFNALDQWGGSGAPTWDQTIYYFADKCDGIGGPKRWPSMDRLNYKQGRVLCYDPDFKATQWQSVNTLMPDEKRLALWKAYASYNSDPSEYGNHFRAVATTVLRISAGGDTDPTRGANGEYEEYSSTPDVRAAQIERDFPDRTAYPFPNPSPDYRNPNHDWYGTILVTRHW
jgi:hypothetical protein